MPSIALTVRYYRLGPPGDEPYIESNFDFATRQVTIPAEQLGLVLVDCWDIHPYQSHLERTNQICQSILAPAAAACRKAGISVIHAPSPPQAKVFGQWTKYASDAELFGTPAAPPDWPPIEKRNGEGDFAQYVKPEVPRLKQWREEQLPQRGVAECLLPQPEDFVIATGEQLHRLCRANGIMHLIYGGFAANMCVPGRDYGTRAFAARGYTIILLRDGTTAIEAHSTLDGFGLTEAAILDTEMIIGYSALSADLIAACEAATAG